jgi:hypothetical protein
MRISTLLAATAALAITTSASAAVTITTYAANNGSIAIDPGFGSLGQTLFADFETTPAGLSGDWSILAAPGVSGVAAAPSGTPTGAKFLTVPNSLPGTATFDMAGSGKGFTEVSFYWGSIDAGNWNKLEVLGVGGSVLATLTGDQLPAPTVANGGQSGFNSNLRVNFATTDAGGITGFRYSANQFAFETDTYAVGAAVPEPATWGLMILGFGMIGAAMRRRQKVSVTYA